MMYSFTEISVSSLKSKAFMRRIKKKKDKNLNSICKTKDFSKPCNPGWGGFHRGREFLQQDQWVIE